MIRRYKVKYYTGFSINYDTPDENHFVLSEGYIVVEAEDMKAAIDMVLEKLRGFCGDIVIIYKAKELIE